MPIGLSKSSIAAFEQCPKRLWLQRHKPELGIQDDGARARFSAGHEVGAAACALVAGGVMVHADPDLAAAGRQTVELLKDPNVGAIFEATLSFDGVLVRVDILERDGAHGWRLVEVKSSTSAKPAHTGDVATQVWVAQGHGIDLVAAAVRHLNSDFVLEQAGDFRGAFADTDLMSEVAPIVARRAEVVAAARETLAGEELARGTGPHCQDPYACEFLAYCRSQELPAPDWPVTILPNGGGKRWLEAGIDDLLAVDESRLTNPKHVRIHRATATGKQFHDRAAAAQAMATWTFPRTWLDFETIAFALPRWVGTRPYEQVPFQFSAHIEDEDGQCRRVEFLSLDGADPRQRCAAALVSAIPTTGSVIAYNASFERGCLLKLAAAFPDHAVPLRGIAARLVDLLPVTRENWYHRDQRGSWSIKAVLPTVAPELAYDTLGVQDGQEAQAAYLEAIEPGTTPERIDELAVQLKAYCGRDTEAMIVLARRLSEPS